MVSTQIFQEENKEAKEQQEEVTKKETNNNRTAKLPPASDQNGKLVHGQSNISQPEKRIHCRDYCGVCCKITTRGKTRALLMKNFLRMWRSVGLMLYNFALPVIQVVLFCLAIGGDPTDIRIGIVTEETTSGKCPDQLIRGCNLTTLSCRYTQLLPKDNYDKVWVKTVNEAKEKVRKGETWGALHFNKNFSTALVKRNFLESVDEKALEESQLTIWIDMSNQQIALMMKKHFVNTYRKFIVKLFEDCGKDPKLGDIPIQFESPIYGTDETSYTDFAAPGVILTIVFFLAVSLTSMSLISERMEGLLDRSLVAGVTPFEILFSHIITQFVVMCGQTTLVLFCTLFIFKVECNGDIFLVILMTLLEGLCGMCFGFVISAVCTFERTAVQVSLGSFYPILLLSGVIWPLEGMPKGLRYIAYGLPLTLATASLRSILSRGWQFTDLDVWLGFVSTIAWIIVFLSISLTMFRAKRG